jgi:hypothetical protein
MMRSLRTKAALNLALSKSDWFELNLGLGISGLF